MGVVTAERATPGVSNDFGGAAAESPLIGPDRHAPRGFPIALLDEEVRRTLDDGLATHLLPQLHVQINPRRVIA